MPPGEYLAGLALFAATWGAVGLAALIVVRRRLAHLGGAPAVLAFGVIVCAGVIAVHLVPGMLGVLSRGTALACGLLVVSAATLVPEAVGARPRRGWGPRPPVARPAWVAVAIAGAGLLVWTATAGWIHAGVASSDIDTLTFHTPNVAKWIQSGSFWRVDQFSPLLANGNYPQNGDVVFLSAILPWETDAFTRLVGIPFLALAALAVYAVALELQAPRAHAAMFALVFASLPAALFATHEGAKTDTIMLASFGAGVLFLLRHFRTGHRSELVLAGVGLGVAFGTKWYGVSSVVALLAFWAAVWLVAGRSPRALAANAGVLSALVALNGGFWLLRNLVVSGNPVLPARVGLGDLTLFDASRDFIRECGGSSIASYVAQPGIWSDFILSAYRDNYGLPGLALAAGVAGASALLAGALGRRRFERRFHARLAALTALAVLLACVYAITPYSAFGARGAPTLVGANARWLLPALLVAAAVTAAAAGRLGRRAGSAVALAGLVAVADGVRRGFAVPRSDVALTAGVLAVAGLGGVLVAAWAGLGAGPPTRRRSLDARPVAALAAVAVIAAAGVGYQRQQRFFDTRYSEGDPVVTYFSQRAPASIRVGLAGIFSVEGLSPVLPAFGPRLRNHVSYVGREVRGQLREYETYAGFRAEVRREGFDLLLVGKGDYPGCEVPGSARREAAWARRAGFRRVADSDRMSLYERAG